MKTNSQTLSPADRQLVLRWAHQIKAELKPGHPAHPTMEAVIRHHSAPPFPVRALDLVAAPLRDQSASVIAWATIGSALFAAAGAALPSIPWAITCVILGALALTIAFDRGEEDGV